MKNPSYLFEKGLYHLVSLPLLVDIVFPKDQHLEKDYEHKIMAERAMRYYEYKFSYSSFFITDGQFLINHNKKG